MAVSRLNGDALCCQWTKRKAPRSSVCEISRKITNKYISYISFSFQNLICPIPSGFRTNACRKFAFINRTSPIRPPGGFLFAVDSRTNKIRLAGYSDKLSRGKRPRRCDKKLQCASSKILQGEEGTYVCANIYNAREKKTHTRDHYSAR